MADGVMPGTNGATDDGGAGAATEPDAGPEGTRQQARARRAGSVPDGATAGKSVPVPSDRPANLSISQGGLREAHAEAIDVRQGGIGRATATDVRVAMGGVGLARAESVSVQMGGIGAAFGDRVEIRQGGTQAAFAREARFGQAFVQTLVANEVVVEQPSAVVFLVARRASGNIKALLDWRGAIAFGAAFGLVVGLLQRGRRDR